jgi:predicted oxidoreductase
VNPVPLEQLGASGPYLSRLVAGCWRLPLSSDRLIEGFIESCLSLGITTFDHAAVYGRAACEDRFGEVLGRSPSLRRKLQVISKCGIVTPSLLPGAPGVYYDSGAQHLRWSVERSLRCLQLEQLDICLLHRPDHLMDLGETATEMRALQQEGKVAHWGVSNFDTQAYQALQTRLAIPLVTNQIEISLVSPGPVVNGTVLMHQANGISPMAWSPLGAGVLTSKHKDDGRFQGLTLKLEDIARKYGAEDISTVAIAWLLRHPARIFPILGSIDARHLAAAAAAFDLTLDKSDWYELASAAGHPAI